MRTLRFLRIASPALAAVAAMLAGTAAAGSRHGIAMYGEPALPPDFVALPHANPDAPKGGRIVFGESGGFDSLNPFILKGRAPFGLSPLTVESLLGRSYDEPFSLYGLLAESIETDDARSFVEFTLRPEARFADGTPVTVEDVMWSFEILGTKGHPRYHAAWTKIGRMEQTGPRSVRFTFNTEDRELPLILGLRPILSKAQWVKAATRVEWVDNLTKRPTSNTVTLNGSHQDNLASPDGQDALCMDQAWVAQVVKSTLAKDLGSSLEPHSLTKLDTITGQELGEDTSKSTKHSPSAVDHLEFTVLGKGFWIC